MKIPGFSAQLDLRGLAWRHTRTAGVEWYPIVETTPSSRGGADDCDSVVLIRMHPGSGYPPHRHVGVEDVLILEGGYGDEYGIHLAGSYVRYPAGSVHSPVALDHPSASGPARPCVMFAIARGGVENIAIHGGDASEPRSKRS